MHFRAPTDNVLTIAHKCWNSLSIKAWKNYKRNEQRNLKDTHPKITLSHFLSKKLSPLSDLIIKVVLAITTPVYSKFLSQVYLRDTTNHRIVHLLRREAQLLIFRIINNFLLFYLFIFLILRNDNFLI